RQPYGPVHFGKRRALAGSRRPFDLEPVRIEKRRLEIALDREGGDELAAALAQFAERDIGSFRWRSAEFLFEFAPGDGERIFTLVIFALRDGPGTFILVLPERPTGMHEENL